MSQNIRAVDGVSPRHGRIWNVDGVGLGEHVGLVHAGEALDGRAVEADALAEGALELRRRDGHGLQRPEHVGEPEADEANVALLERTKDEVFLLTHGLSLARCVLRQRYVDIRRRYAGRVPQLRLALAQVNARVGDLEGNAELVLASCRDAAERGAHSWCCRRWC